MSDISVRPLTGDEWETYKEIRLRALRESPEAFAATHDEEAAWEESGWRSRMERSHRLLAEVPTESAPVGVVSIGQRDAESPETAELFGLWVAPEWRGRSVAATLVQRGAEYAATQGVRHLSYWVGSDNGRAVAFASSFGFRPTDDRRPMRVATEETAAEQEIAMTLPLGEDRG